MRGLNTSIASMSLDHGEHVLVVGDGVQAVERVRDVDEPALVGGSPAIVSASVIPRGIFSSMNRPITSPWSAVLTSSPTITLTPYSAALARASCAPETSLWSVTAIAPRPTSRAVASSTSTGVAQSLEWSVCMCRSTSISLRLASRARTSGRGSGSWRSAASSA